MKVLRVRSGYFQDGADGHYFKCPGCNDHHILPTTGPRAWGFNGDLNSPTFNPSILAKSRYQDDSGKLISTVCHSFVRGGRIEFLSDCTHQLAGKTIELPEMKEHEDLK